MLSPDIQKTVGASLILTALGVAIYGRTVQSVAVAVCVVGLGLLLIWRSHWRKSGFFMCASVVKTAWVRAGVEYRGFDHHIELWHEELTLQPFRIKLTFDKNPKPETAFIRVTTEGEERRHSHLKPRWSLSGRVFTAKIDRPVRPNTRAMVVLKNCAVDAGEPKDVRYFYES